MEKKKEIIKKKKTKNGCISLTTRETFKIKIFILSILYSLILLLLSMIFKNRKKKLLNELIEGKKKKKKKKKFF